MDAAAPEDRTRTHDTRSNCARVDQIAMPSGVNSPSNSTVLR